MSFRRWAHAALLGVPLSASAQSLVLVDHPVKVVAEVRKDARSEAGVTPLAIEVRDGDQAFRFDVLTRGEPAAALAAQQRVTGFKDGHLFIRDDCPADGARQKRRRCALDKVFAWAETSSGKRLIYVGDVAAGEECEAPGKVGCALFDGTFTDLYVQPETGALTPSADVPPIFIEMKLQSGEFVVDLEDTWGRNQERFRAGERCLAALKDGPPARDAACADGIQPRLAYLFNAALATYTRREAVLAGVHTHARAALCEGLDDAGCGNTLRASALFLARVAPGARPQNRGVVRALRRNASAPAAP